MTGEALLRVCDLAAGYGKKQVLFGVSLEVRPGELVVIIGPNGAGKSTVVKTIMGFIRPWSGEIRFGSAVLNGLRVDERARLGISYVPQGRTVFPGLTVEEHLELGAWLVSSRAEKRAALERVYGLFPILWERRRQRAGTLSGGERQMLSLARALMLRPKLLLLDEPSLGLSPRLVVGLFEKLREVRGQGIAILAVEQNAAVALQHADRGYVLDQGVNRLEGPARGLLADPRVRSVYLGGSLYEEVGGNHV